MVIDTERFIMEIERRPAIWDVKSSQYSDRFQKVGQWEEIIALFSTDGISDKQKKEKGRILQAKWKNLRDAFIKECRKQAKLRSGAATTATSGNQYRYYNHLMFLKPFAANNDAQSNGALEVETELAGNTDSIIPPPQKKMKSIVPQKEIGRGLVDVLKSSLNQTENINEDSDRQFMLSLVPDLKKVPDRLKSVVKMNLLKCITEAQEEVTYQCHYCSVQCKTELPDTSPS